MAKNYIKGSYRRLNSKTAGDVIIASVLVFDLQKIANEKGYANIVISERKETDQYGNTHYAYENDYDPQAKAGVKQVKADKLNPPNFSESVGQKPTPANSGTLGPNGRRAYNGDPNEGTDLPF